MTTSYHAIQPISVSTMTLNPITQVDTFTPPVIEPAATPPFSALLSRCARSCFSTALAHPLTKTAAGALFTIGLTSDYLGDSGGDFLGGYGRVFAIAASTIWLASTGLSSALLPDRRNMATHISASIGFAVAGTVLVPLDSHGFRICLPVLEISLTDCLYGLSAFADWRQTE